MTHSRFPTPTSTEPDFTATRHYPGRDSETGTCGTCAARRHEPHTEHCCRYEPVTDGRCVTGFVHVPSIDDLLANLHYNGVHVRCRPARGRVVSGTGTHSACAHAGDVDSYHGHDFDGPLLCGCDDPDVAQ